MKLSHVLAAAAFLATASSGVTGEHPVDRPVAPPPREVGPKREYIAPAARGERLPDRLKVGDPAPDFTLKTPDGKQEVALSGFKGRRPVVLIFASYT